ncbi:hypothetical protein WA158_004486 [Blastocystis sp. Blastoise]
MLARSVFLISKNAKICRTASIFGHIRSYTKQVTHNDLTDITPYLITEHHENPNIQRLVDSYNTYTQTMSSSVASSIANHSIKEIFPNTDVNMNSLNVIGFDYDFTLVHYTEDIQYYIYRTARDYLIDHMRYPEIFRKSDYDPSFAIRGLIFDSKRGFLLKLNYLNNISKDNCYKGKTLVPNDDVITIYNGSRHLPQFYIDKYCHPMLDLFSLSKACLISDLIQFMLDHKYTYEPTMIFQDCVKAIDYVHNSGLLSQEVLSDLPRYIEPNTNLRELFTEFKNDERELFLLTNNSYEYVNPGMNYLIGDDWKKFFDVTICHARKPAWFVENRPFRLLNQSTGVWNWDATNNIKRGDVVSFGWGKGDKKVLYFGDSLYSDLIEPSRSHGWTTGAIIKELEDEIEVENKPGYNKLVVVIIESKSVSIRRRLSRLINPYFGSMFRSENNPSMFAFRLMRYVDLYTTQLDNFKDVPLKYKYYPPRMSLPHEPFGSDLQYPIRLGMECISNNNNNKTNN